MNEILLIIAAFVAGIALGIIFFGGLWITVKKSVNAKVPWLWVLGSFIVRVGIVMPGFYFISSGNWQRLVSCLIGFIAARFVVIHFTRAIDEKHIQLRKEVAHEA
ncbi:MAG: ATP synthase subunit I [Chitinophagaceae bacterium]|jgi:F1F0 ATPase subunit 2|nr:ATP synthase subunit I [Chitinophagaceae bacterium]